MVTDQTREGGDGRQAWEGFFQALPGHHRRGQDEWARSRNERATANAPIASEEREHASGQHSARDQTRHGCGIGRDSIPGFDL